ncbi:transcription factor Ouib-like [Arctopsyche grandis]|uniref:transcription factor Ouib-like n=1 Tax=Arctopsyche grandis TaxID=121162 RepID=UPI00406D90B1
MIECRLCLGPAPAESSVSIFGDPHPECLEHRIRTCCQIYVKRGDRLPDTVCLSCKTNLESLISFRKACFRSNETSQLRLDDCLNIKREEVFLENVIWDDEPSLPTIHQENNEICSKPFPSESKLVVHTKEKPLKCVICLKSFSRKPSLEAHKKLHPGIQPYKCDVCLKSFILKNKLVIHLISHTGEKTLLSKSKLILHKTSHTGEKPFKCDTCLKSFIYKCQLVLHLRSHMGEKQ